MPSTLRRLLNAPSVRFLVAGGLAASVNWSVRFPLSSVIPFSEAVVVAHLVGCVVGFALYRHFVFSRSAHPLWREGLVFMTVNAASLAGVLAVSLTAARLLRGLGAPDMTADAVSHATGIAAGAVLSFRGHKAFTFAATPGRRDPVIA